MMPLEGDKASTPLTPSSIDELCSLIDASNIAHADDAVIDLKGSSSDSDSNGSYYSCTKSSKDYGESDSHSARELFDLVYARQFTVAEQFLLYCDDDEATKQLMKRVTLPTCNGRNALMVAASRGGASEELIRLMVRRGPAKNYIDEENEDGRTAASDAANFNNAETLEVLLTLGANPKGCHEVARSWNNDAILNILHRFAQRMALACCLRHYDELHQTIPLDLHPDIAALDTLERILHDLHGINGDSHDISRKIISYL
jgi:ankyrin repeat protein